MGYSQSLPQVEGRVKASLRLIRKGCLRRLRMQTSRSTRLACSGLLSTSGMRLRATCTPPCFLAFFSSPIHEQHEHAHLLSACRWGPVDPV